MKLKSKLLPVVICLFFMFGIANSYAMSTPPSPVLMDVNTSGVEGDWFVGAIPPNYNASKPVLVFVQGLHGKASDWWGPTKYYGNNDMYAYAYSSGYRTAFVNFVDADGKSAGTMWRNGEVLSNQLRQICAYYKVNKVNLVCHSKGGVDAQSAIVHYGAYAYVDKVFTLSTPHWGSQLADLANSKYASWLANILGFNDEGTKSLQVANMASFRAKTDNRSENNSITYYTAAGTNWGPNFSELWIAGMYLKSYGSNDGLVTVTNAKNPRATHVSTSNLNHDNIRMGSKVWSFVEPKIRTLSTTALKSASTSQSFKAYAATPDMPEQSSNSLLRGGSIENEETTTVPVESNVNSVIFDLVVANPDVTTTITAPDGTELTPKDIVSDNDYFNGATHLVTTVKKPKAGMWKISMKSKEKNAYLLMTNYDSSLSTKITSDKKSVKKGKSIKLGVGLKGEFSKKVKNARAKVSLYKSQPEGRNIIKVNEFNMDLGGKIMDKELGMPSESGTYTFDVSIQGTMADGSQFERTLVQSAVVEQ